jgi:hypothetical protein
VDVTAQLVLVGDGSKRASAGEGNNGKSNGVIPANKIADTMRCN